MPAVQAAREAARRMQCTNKMKQLGLALQNYHDAYDSLPSLNSSVRIRTGMMGGVSAFIPLLPFLEQTAVYDLFPRTNQGPWTNALDTAYGGGAQNNPWCTQVEALICPSESGTPGNNTTELGRNNYMFCVGDWIDSSGSNGDSTIGVNPRAIFALRVARWESMAAILDGTSNTIAMSEVCLGTAAMATYVKVGNAYQDSLAWDGATLESSAGVPKLCLDTRNGNVYSGVTARYNKGNRWGHTILTYSTFATILPPNGPSCAGYNPNNYSDSGP